MFYLDLKTLDYVGFKKMHPHDDDSIIRLSLADKTKTVSTLKVMLETAIDNGLAKLQSIMDCFTGSQKK
jgi:DNA-directed RNA polymerase subunit L